MVRATAPLTALFGTLRKAGVQIAVVTSDDRRPTVTALEWLEVADQVTFMVCADDGYPYKPAPEAVWAACEATGIAATATVMVGDSTTDMLMAQRAGVGLRVAVLTGTMDASILAPQADVVLASVGDIRAAV
jgi:phosphoglycolate phosphatase